MRAGPAIALQSIMGLPEDIPVFAKPVRFPELRARIERIFSDIDGATARD